MIKYLSAALTALTMAVGAYAADVTATPGQLSAVIADAANESSLTVTGSINAADLHYISTAMPALRSLDLSGAVIVDYDGDKLMGYRHHPANTIPAACFAGSQITSVSLPAGVALGDGAWASSALQTVSVPADASMGMGVFAGCTSLTSATVPTAPAGTFSGCTALTTVSVINAADLGASAFSGCSALNHVEAQNVSTIGTRAFAGCSALKSFDFGSHLTAIGPRAFAQSGLTGANLNGATQRVGIGPWAFVDCRQLGSLTLPADYTLGHGAFFGCASLKSIYSRLNKDDYRLGTPSLPDYAFTGATALDANTIIGPTVDSLGRYALAGNRGTTMFYLQPSVQHLGDHAMAGMTELTHLTATGHNEVPTLGQNVWDGINQNNITLEVNENMASAFLATPQWNAFHIDIVTNLEDNIAADLSQIRGRFVGTDIEIDLGSVEAREIALYDFSGLCLSRTVPAGSVTVLPTADFQTNAYLVVVQLTNGTQLSLKLMR